MADTIVPSNSPPSQPGRRAILARFAAVPMVAAVPADAADRANFTVYPDPHPAWLAEWQTLVDWCNGPEPGARELQDFPQYHRTLELEDLIGATPTTTLAGASAQLRLMRYWCTPDSMPNETLNAALENALATVERLAGGQAHG
jgi:hypothetical protein